jgi:hypothetical protein
VQDGGGRGSFVYEVAGEDEVVVGRFEGDVVEEVFYCCRGLA